MTHPRKVAVAMSGGVDSSAAAALLLQQGFEVTGVTFRLFGCDIAAGAAPDSRTCCSQQDVVDAMEVAHTLGIPHEVMDFADLFETHVIRPFVESYRQARTPNPCILCNQHIKFAAFVEWAQARGISHVATGHHAIIDREGERWRLRRGQDRAKDQTYFLFPMPQAVLSRVLFPVGGITKPEVREVARTHGLPVASKTESQEICFAAGGPYADFLEVHGGLAARPGDIVHVDGRVLGRHGGLHRYTVGQRKGLGIAAREPLYVVRKEAENGCLVVGPREALACAGLTARAPVWTAGWIPDSGTRLAARIRYRSAAVPAMVTRADDAAFELAFEAPVAAVAPGQAAVLYAGDEVVGGGWIETTRAG